MKVVKHVLEAYSEELQGKDVLRGTDNRNAEIVLSVESRVKELHQEAVAVYKPCTQFTMHWSVAWVSRDTNVQADVLSRFDDPNDYMLDSSCFQYIHVAVWDPHTEDRFASISTPHNVRDSAVVTAT